MISNRRATCLLAIALCATGAMRAYAEGPPEGTQPAQWRLIWKIDPSTQATLSWSTALPGKVHRVHLRGGAPSSEPDIIDCQRNGQYTASSRSLELYYHHARLTNLKPGSLYRVVMESDGARSPEMVFITAPSDERPFSLLVGGDSRTGLEDRRRVNRMISGLVAERPSILALAHGGDYVVRGRSLPLFSQWMTDYELTVTKDGRLLPIIPTRGNHDSGPLFDEIFDFPPDDGNYFATTLSPLVRLITLNTNISVAGDQAEWLDAQLARARPKCNWLLAEYHQPAYPAVKSPGPAKASWTPIFDKHDVDLVCESDGHVIKRTVPIRGDRMDPTGVVYVGEGGLGVPQREPKADRWYLQPPGMSARGHHVQLLSFDKEKLTFRVILLGGEVRDEYTLNVRPGVGRRSSPVESQ